MKKSRKKQSDKASLRYMLLQWRQDNPHSVIFAALRIPVLLLLPLLMALVPKIILDCMEKQTDYKTFAVIVMAVSLLIVSLRWLEPFLSAKLNLAAQSFRLHCTMQMLQKLLKADYAVLEHPSTKQKLDAARQFAFEGRFSDSQQVYEIITLLAANLFGIFSYGVMLLRIHPAVLDAFILSAAVELFLLQRRNKNKREYKTAAIPIFSQADYLYRSSSEAEAGKDIRVFRIDKWFGKLFSDLLQRLLSANSSFIRQNLAVSAACTVLLLLREILGFIMLFYLVWNDKISIADAVFFCGVIFGFLAWTAGLSQQIESLYSVCDSCTRFREFLDVEDTVKITVTANSTITADIELRNVSFLYPNTEKPVLNNINLTINAGERVALVGENGAGKTTLVNLICGFYQPTTGELLINEIPASERQTKINALFQDFVLLPMSIKNNIALCNDKEIDVKKLEQALHNAGLWDKISSLPDCADSEMISEVHENAIGFSGGEVQRLLLARALYHDAPVLLLDEPTSALDPLAEEQLYRCYDRLTIGKTMLFISHRLSSTRFCDRIILLIDGQIADEGTHDELLEKRGVYWRMFETQSAAYRNAEEGGEVLA